MAKDAAEKAEKLEKVEKTEKNDKAEKSSKSEKSDKAAKPEKAEKGKATKAEQDEENERDFSYTQNREISWLRFDDRILDEAYDETVPVFERLKFCEIVESNLDEWFMIRVGGLSDLASLKNQPKDNKSNMTPTEQLAALAVKENMIFHHSSMILILLMRVDSLNLSESTRAKCDNTRVGQLILENVQQRKFSELSTESGRN